MLRKATIAGVVAAAVAVGGWTLPAFAASPGTLSGTAFLDTDRDGSHDTGEAVRSGDRVYLYTAAGTYLRNATTDATGRYAFVDLPGGDYRVAYSPSSWWAVRANMVSTTADLRASQAVAVDGPVTADFGWRQIVRSTTAGAPITSFTGPEGLKVESYGDVVTARELYDAVNLGHVGPEAASTTVRFDLGSTSTTTTSVGSNGGRYTSFKSTVSATWLSWLDGGDNTLSHEYGHAWSLYRAYLVQQDSTLAGYLRARGLEGDARVGTGEWSPRELVAEDYRQLLGSPSAAASPQANREIPAAAAVPGLRDYLLGTFSTAASVEPAPSPAPTVSSSPTVSTSPTATASPTASPSTPATASASTSPTASPTTGPTKKKCRSRC